MRVKHD
jgi:3'-5' exonuclease